MSLPSSHQSRTRALAKPASNPGRLGTSTWRVACRTSCAEISGNRGSVVPGGGSSTRGSMTSSPSSASWAHLAQLSVATCCATHSAAFVPSGARTAAITRSETPARASHRRAVSAPPSACTTAAKSSGSAPRPQGGWQLQRSSASRRSQSDAAVATSEFRKLDILDLCRTVYLSSRSKSFFTESARPRSHGPSRWSGTALVTVQEIVQPQLCVKVQSAGQTRPLACSPQDKGCGLWDKAFSWLLAGRSEVRADRTELVPRNHEHPLALRLDPDNDVHRPAELDTKKLLQLLPGRTNEPIEFILGRPNPRT